MKYSLQFALQSIAYTGDSIGDDIQLYIGGWGETFEQKFQLKYGKTSVFEPSTVIFEESVDYNNLSIEKELEIKIVEWDAKSPDEGKAKAKYNIEVSTETPFLFSQTIKVEEAGIKKKKVGVFTFYFIVSITEHASTKQAKESATGVPNPANVYAQAPTFVACPPAGAYAQTPTIVCPVQIPPIYSPRGTVAQTPTRALAQTPTFIGCTQMCPTAIACPPAGVYAQTPTIVCPSMIACQTIRTPICPQVGAVAQTPTIVGCTQICLTIVACPPRGC